MRSTSIDKFAQGKRWALAAFDTKQVLKQYRNVFSCKEKQQQQQNAKRSEIRIPKVVRQLKDVRAKISVISLPFPSPC